MSKKRKLSPNAREATPSQDTSVDRPTGMQLMLDVAPEVFALFLSFMYTGTYPSSVDYAPKDTIPLSIRAWLLGQKLRSVGFMNYAMARVFHGVGRYWALGPGIVGVVWAGTAVMEAKMEGGVGIKTEEGKEKEKDEEKMEEEEDAMDTITPPSTPPKPSSVKNTTETAIPILSPSPLRALVLSLLTTYWSSAEAPYITRHERSSWEAVFDAYPDLRREFIFGLRGSRKMLVV
jgi:hypothetical protein